MFEFSLICFTVSYSFPPIFCLLNYTQHFICVFCEKFQHILSSKNVICSIPNVIYRQQTAAACHDEKKLTRTCGKEFEWQKKFWTLKAFPFYLSEKKLACQVNSGRTRRKSSIWFSRLDKYHPERRNRICEWLESIFESFEHDFSYETLFVLTFP